MEDRGLVKILLCFDCDGTLYTTETLGPDPRVSQSPIPLERLEALTEAGVQIVMVSPSDACEHLPYPRIIPPERVDALRESAKQYPADLLIYVSDNYGDNKVAEQAGFSYILPG